MNKEFIPYEQALELKELGFNEQCFGFYNPLHELETLRKEVLYDVDGGVFKHWNEDRYSLVAAPLYQQAFRWFREKYNLQSHIFLTYEGVTTNEHNEYAFATLRAGGYDYVIDDDNYTYEETELACLKKLIEIVKSK
jgi:hypothetical protein